MTFRGFRIRSPASRKFDCSLELVSFACDGTFDVYSLCDVQCSFRPIDLLLLPGDEGIGLGADRSTLRPGKVKLHREPSMDAVNGESAQLGSTERFSRDDEKAPTKQHENAQ